MTAVASFSREEMCFGRSPQRALQKLDTGSTSSKKINRSFRLGFYKLVKRIKTVTALDLAIDTKLPGKGSRMISRQTNLYDLLLESNRQGRF